jgi:Rod binding domain-containing protein
VNPLSVPPIELPPPAPLALDRLAAGGPSSSEKIKQASQEFEAIFLSQILKGLRRTVPGQEEKSAMSQSYLELVDEQLAADLAKKGGIGLGRMIQAYMSQSGVTGPAAASDGRT